jgi:4,5:9,10-diseco-3-hydroxy-5,9,17-trioxoandrosta-1(10),2-diene-4-oate hydrolase
MLAGWGCTAYSFRHNIPAIAEAGWRVVVVEPPGQGWSDKMPDPAAYTLESLAGRVLGILDRVGVTKAAPFVGLSLGGAVALQTALVSPDRVSRLGLWSPIGFGCARIVRLGGLLSPALAPLLERTVGPRFVGLALRIVYGGSHPPSPRDVAEYAAPIGSRDFVRAQIELLRNVRWSGFSGAERARLRLPISIVAGTKDPFIPLSCLRDAAESLSDARLRIVKGAGHAPNETHPAAVNAETIGFLRVPDAMPTV